MQNKDVVAHNPEISGEFTIKDKQPGYYEIATIDGIDHYYIHTRATLPLKDIHEGIGFGLWVEVTKEVLDDYLAAENDDEKYAKFEAEGILANNWPGFENTQGLKVKIKTVVPSQKIYIWEVFVYDTVDPLFQIALTMQKDQIDLKNRVRQLVEAWMHDFGPGKRD